MDTFAGEELPELLTALSGRNSQMEWLAVLCGL
jgi:hypothetical protein